MTFELRNRHPERSGMILLEAIAAGAILGALMVVCLQMFSAVAAQRRAADQRRCATVQLANAMERIAARPWTELTEADLAQEQKTLSPSAADQLPGAELKIEVAAEPKEPQAKRITVALRWQDRAGQLIAPMTLTTWKYKPKK